MTQPMPQARRLCRSPERRVFAGVAGGLAEHLGVSAMVLRIGFVVLAGFDGLGALLYVAFWAVLPPAVAVPRRRRDVAQLVPLVALGVGVLLLSAQFAGGRQATLGWLVTAMALGAGLIWHQADPKRRQRLNEQLSGALAGNRRSALIPYVAGAVLLVVGVVGIVAVFSPVANKGIAALVNGLLFTLLALGGVGVALAPVLWRVFTQLRTEREGRIREQERAELAAMIHDQVLHTLALIQRNSGDVKTVQRLARGQERTLRSWLYKPTASPTERLSAALEEAAAEVEDTYAVTVETVVVGDRDVDDRIAALVAAAREALVNAARHAKVATVSLYAEVEDDQTSVFVRDRGVGFDPAELDPDRHGVRGSILGRMQRHGGRAEIRSEPGDGTEVRLYLPTGAESRRGGWLGGREG